MHCKDIMTHEVQWIAPDESVARAAELMALHSWGFLPICSADGTPLGVITDRDIALRVIGKNRLAAQVKVEEVMTTQVHSVGRDCPVDELGEVMAEAGVSRMLVLDQGGRLEGVVSVGDLMVRGPGHTALKTARGLYARAVGESQAGTPHAASNPAPEFFRGARDLASSDEDFTAENPARAEAEGVASGGDNPLKEFPA
jgi:CBS domain-containing protein